jgi:hypothetical protein
MMLVKFKDVADVVPLDQVVWPICRARTVYEVAPETDCQFKVAEFAAMEVAFSPPGTLQLATAGIISMQ